MKSTTKEFAVAVYLSLTSFAARKGPPSKIHRHIYRHAAVDVVC